MGLVQPLPAQIAKIKVVGIGGGGGNAVNFMASGKDIGGVDFVAINTDAQDLLRSQAKIKIQIGEKNTRGLGSGGDPLIGEEAAEESREKIKKVLEGTDMIFLAVGVGGGTGTGAAPVIADIAKNDLGALTIAVTTKPFIFEGTKRMVIADEGVEKLKKVADTLITIPNQKLLDAQNEEMSFLDAFRLADSVLAKGVEGIAEIITVPGLINLDFADVKSIMHNAGSALMGIGVASGENRVQEAVKQATNSSLLDLSIKGARGVLFNITGGQDLSMNEVNQIAQLLSQDAGGDANIIFGATIDDSYNDQVKITLIATGFDEQRAVLSSLIKPSAPIIKDDEQAKAVKKDKDPVDKKRDKKKEEEKDIFTAAKIDKDDLPDGVEMETPIDIPAFLRKTS